jgi:cytoskeletal protein RodZ
MKYNQKNKSRTLSSRPVMLLVISIGVIALGYLLWQHYHHTTTVIPSTVPASSKSSQTQKGDNSQQTTPTSTTQTTTTTSDKTASEPSTSAPLKAPSGTFVSNHSPNIGGVPAPSSESSVCNTTPGATCTISFTKDNQTKTLQSQTADNNGNVYWNWNINTAGLSVGNWQISATATLNGKSLTTVDKLTLDVSP